MDSDMENSATASSCSSSGESLDEFHRNILQAGEVQGYQFEPRRDSISDESNEDNMWIDDDLPLRLENTDW